jgi:hypothetical protein
MAGVSGAEPSSFADADVIAQLREANAALREVITPKWCRSRR